jgi:hypothetical protein
MYVVSPTGEASSSYANRCDNDARNFNMFNHECRVVTSHKESKVLTLAYAVRDGLGNWTALDAMDSTMGAQWKKEYGANKSVDWVGDRLIAWSPSGGSDGDGSDDSAVKVRGAKKRDQRWATTGRWTGCDDDSPVRRSALPTRILTRRAAVCPVPLDETNKPPN